MVMCAASELINKSYEINFNHNKKSHNRVENIEEILCEMDKHSFETLIHCFNVSIYATSIGKKAGLNGKNMEELWLASILHDVGKLKISSDILNKKLKLSSEEFESIKTHPIKGHDIVKGLRGFNNIAPYIIEHHERYDGKGYPYGKSGRDINLMSRIISVADSFDAMVSMRPYKEPRTKADAIEELKNQKWKQFDGNIVDCFTDIVNYIMI